MLRNEQDPCPQDYELGPSIYKNQNSVVNKAIIKATNDPVVIKRLHLDDYGDIQGHAIKLVMREVKIMSVIHHENLMPTIESFLSDAEVWIIMPQMDYSLTNLIPITDARLLSAYFYFIIEGLVYLHEQNIIHRDIKSGNVLISADGSVKLSDYGVSRFIDVMETGQEKPLSFVGTPYWMSPEMIENKGNYDYKTDIWSLGITLLEVYFGLPPHSEHKPMKALLKIFREAPPRLEKDESKSKLLRAFVQTCLKKDPAKRPTATTLLKHRFIKKLENSVKRKAYIRDSLSGPSMQRLKI